MSEAIEEAKLALEKIQQFDCDSLSRQEKLGQSFADVVVPTKRLIRFYQQIPPNVTEDLSYNLLDELEKRANDDFALLQHIFNSSSSPLEWTSKGDRDNYVEEINCAYNNTFEYLYPLISYGTNKSADFQRLENEARATIQATRNEADAITNRLKDYEEQAQSVLAEVKDVAAQQGVSQQAIYFKEESEKHEEESEKWRWQTVWLSLALGGYAFLSLFIHKIDWLKPEDAFQSAQLVTSKILIFAVIAYMLFLAAKNFLSHKHNAVVNKHRQNALMTFKAISAATTSNEAEDVVLNHAASCIFSPQDTGYVKNENNNNNSIVEILPNTMRRLSE